MGPWVCLAGRSMARGGVPLSPGRLDRTKPVRLKVKLLSAPVARSDLSLGSCCGGGAAAGRHT